MAMDLKMKKIASFVVMALLVASCDLLPTPENDAKKAVKSLLIDTESARFERVIVPEGGGAVCGFVNGKNRMGGYAGETPFIYLTAAKLVMMYPGKPTKNDLRSLSALSGNFLSGDKNEYQEKWSSITEACKFPMEWKNNCKSNLHLDADDDICTAWNKGPDSKEFYKLLVENSN